MSTYMLPDGTPLTLADGNNPEITYNDIIDVRKLGCKGDGTDESALISMAIQNLDFGSILYFPKGETGNYVIGSVLPVITQRCHIKFDIGASLTASTDLPYLLKVTASNCIVENVYLDDGGFSVPKMLFFSGSTGNDIKHFRSKGSGGNTALYFDDALNGNEGSWVQTLSFPQIHMGDNVGSTGIRIGKLSNSFRIIAPQIHHCGIGIDITGTLASLQIFAGDIEYNVLYGVKAQTTQISQALNNVGMYGVYFESNGLADIYFPAENSSLNIYPLLIRGLTLDTCYFESNIDGSFIDHIYIGDANLAIHYGIDIKGCRFGNKGATINGKCFESFERGNWTFSKSGSYAKHLHRIGTSSNGDHVEIETTSHLYVKALPTANCIIDMQGALNASLTANAVTNTVQSTTSVECLFAGGGFVCKTPNGTKRYRIGVDDSGVLVVTLI